MLPSANVPVAVSGRVEPLVTIVVVEVMFIVFSAEVLTMTPADDDTPSCDAVTVVLPDATAVTRPALTVATPAEELLHFAVLVTSLLSPFTVVPLAVNCLVSPTVRKMEAGVTLMLFRALPETKKSPHPLEKNASRRRRRTAELRMFATALIVRIMREFYQNGLL